MSRKSFVLVLMVFVSLCTNAKLRDWQQMLQIAQNELAPTEVGHAMRMAGKNLKVLDDRQAITVVGYEDGGFVVMATDDMYPAVLGSSESRYNPQTENENFKWWLESITRVVSMPRTQPLKLISPDTDKYPASISPIVKTKWDQDSPYNNLCPNGCPTGCVATATAQVINFLKWPVMGMGPVFTYVPFGDFDGKKYEANLDGQVYDYNNMLNTYYGSETRVQKSAVAKLMYHVGLAMKAQYGSAGTGSYNEPLAHGMRSNFGFPYAVTVDKDRYTEEQWMDMIFHCISDSLPIVYGGSDETYTGHEFVLHGYNSFGRVFINWGWGGQEDGYFDLASLLIYWGIYDFRNYQDMLIRMDPKHTTTEMVEVTVEVPGTLAELLSDEQRDTVIWLKVNGNINGTDLKTLRLMAGSDEKAKGTWGNLSVLDLSDGSIVAGGEPYLIEGNEQWSTTDDEMPYKAFYNCSMLINVKLPSSLKRYSDGVFAGCNNLEQVQIATSDEREFVVDDNQVLTADRTQLIEQWPSEELRLSIPQGVTVVHPYAFASRYLYEQVVIPEGVEEIGAYAFNRCFDLSRTFVCAAEPPVIEPSAIDDLDLALRYLYVPKNSLSAYKKAAGWKKYGSRIVGFDAETLDVGQLPQACPAANDIYAVDGRLVRKAHEGTRGLQPGIYVVAGKKLILR